MLIVLAAVGGAMDDVTSRPRRQGRPAVLGYDIEPRAVMPDDAARIVVFPLIK